MNLIESLPSNPPLTKSEEAKLARGGEVGQTKLVMANVKEAMVYCRPRNNSIPDDELLSLVYAALQRCVKRFVPGKASRFFSFCKPELRGSVARYQSSQALVRNAVEVCPLNAVDTLSPSGTGSRKMYDDRGMLIIEAPSEPSVDFDFDTVFRKDRWPLIEKAMKATLSKMDRATLMLAYHGGLNFNEIGKLLGVHRSAIQQHHARAIQKIRRYLEVRRLLVK